MTIELLTRGYIVKRIQKIVNQTVLSPTDGQSILVKALDLERDFKPMEALGIHQSDVIIRTAIVAALADLRRDPQVLDYIFSSLPADELTRKDYGEKSVAQAKKWFLNNKIDVVMSPVMDKAKAPLITIKLMDSNEAETTLGDVHYITQEFNEESWPALTEPFNPSYNPATGNFTVTLDQIGGLYVVPGMSIIDGIGKAHEIIAVNEDGFTIAQGTVADFRQAVLKGRKPARVTTLESVAYKETYQIGVHVAGEPVYLTWLHSIVVFCLLRYKQALLESRGYARSVVNSSGFDKNEQMSTEEHIFSRYMSITGYVRQYWPKVIGAQTIQTVETGDADRGVVGAGIVVNKGGKMEPTIDPADSLYMGDEDVITPKKK